MLAILTGNVLRGVFGNQEEVNAKTLQYLTDAERLAFYSNPDVREQLAFMPVDRIAELASN